jgi:murein DD-endopeptidase MepM/ murein hydrolase activator NlpD
MAPPVERAETPSPKPAPVRYIATGKVIAAKRMYRDYQVRKGDHLDAVARDLQTTPAVLLEANHLKNANVLVPGQHLKVPIEKAYVTEPGDTLAAVARRFDISEADLADLNVMSEHQKLRPGEQLALPAVYHDRGPVAAPTTYTYARSPSYGSSPYGASSYGTPSSGRYTPSPWASAAGESHGGTYAYQPSVRAPLPYPSTTAPTAPERTDAELSAAGQGRFVWPVRGEILSAFGVQDVGRRNDGVDIKSPQAAAAGEVVYAGDQVPGFGNLVLVKHADGWVTAYAHLDKVSVKMRETVVQDQEIGQVGQTGGVAEPQLHFEVRYAATPIEKAKPINPLLVLPQ